MTKAGDMRERLERLAVGQQITLVAVGEEWPASLQHAVRNAGRGSIPQRKYQTHIGIDTLDVKRVQ